MKNFNFNLLQYLNNKKAEKGFTLIELLVVIIIIGILSAIALPAFLNQANKARQSEAKQALGAVTRGQQAYYLERQIFSQNVDGLGLGVKTETENYLYSEANTTAGTAGLTKGGGTDGTAGAAFGVDTTATKNGFTGFTRYAVVYAAAKNQDAVRDYFGIAYSIPASASTESTTVALLCEEETLFDGAATEVITAQEAEVANITDTNVVANCKDPGDGSVTVILADNGQPTGQ